LSQVYPAPTIVLGVGRFGLATLERLGEDWMGLALSGADETLANLRLIAALPADDREAPGDGENRSPRGPGPWRSREIRASRIARELGEGDLPSRALDFVLLRSLGLVRYRDGAYEVGIPRDGGAIEVEEPGRERDGGGEARQHSSRTIRRRRYFHWISLSPDPIVAAERLRQATERYKDLDLFLTPLVNRVRQGHSPRALLATISRCFALLESRDPTPWPWLRGALEETVDPAVDPTAPGPSGSPVRLDLGAALLDQRSALRATEGYLGGVPTPLPSWKPWLTEDGGETGDLPTLEVWLPRPFDPRTSDVEMPLDPMDLLARDWEVTGWAADEKGTDAVSFLPVRTTPWRLGLFDHDSRRERPGVRQRFEARLEELGRNARQGLLRLWVDLQRVRVSETIDGVVLQGRMRDHLADGLQQSLELIGELLVRPLADGQGPDDEPSDGPGEDGGEDAGPEPCLPDDGLPRRPRAQVERDLSDVPSRFLSGLVVDERATEDPVMRLLVDRLGELGLTEAGETEGFRHPLLTTIRLDPEDGDEADDATSGPERPPGGLRTLRRCLNHQVRRLLDVRLLARYRQHPTRRPPRLTVFVVGDMSEPFVRASMRPILRDVHAELLRAFTPIFQSFRQGFDRSLCITPILWMPHPADPFKGAPSAPSRCEEAAIIDSIHGIRNWVECVLPPGRRFIPQIFVNSRITDVASLDLREAVRQTRDFLSLQLRNDLAADQWLRRIASGSGQSDLFSSFSCYEIDFPALRCREYLAGFMARELLDQVKGKPAAPVDEWTRDREEEEHRERLQPFAPKPLDGLVEPAREKLAPIIRDAATSLRTKVDGRGRNLDTSTPGAEIRERFDDAFLQGLHRELGACWQQLTGRTGEVDEAVDRLRYGTSEELVRKLVRLRQAGDQLVEEDLGEGGLLRAFASFGRTRRWMAEQLQKREAERREKEAQATRHSIPQPKVLDDLRDRIHQAADRKPDADPIRLGLFLWLALAAILGTPLAHAVAYLRDLHLHPGVLEALLGPLAPVTGGLALFLPCWWLVHQFLDRRTRAVRQAIDEMAEGTARLVQGGPPPLFDQAPSIRSFLESRLELTGAVATRAFSARLFERAVADVHLADRLVRSVDVQARVLERRAEDLGVRSAMGQSRHDENLDGLLEGHGNDRRERLISPNELRLYYAREVRDESDLRARTHGFIAAAGGLEHWRLQAAFGDTERVLEHCRKIFAPLVDEPVASQGLFADELGRRLVEFVGRYYSNIGFGAEFRGFEGLDPDGVEVTADASLVLHKELGRVFEGSRGARPDIPTTRTMDVHAAEIRPNAVYMLSLVQGIRVYSVRNLRRFESFHDRVQMPDDRAFPLTQESRDDRPTQPVNPLSGFEHVARGRSFGGGRRGGAPPAEGDEP